MWISPKLKSSTQPIDTQYERRLELILVKIRDDQVQKRYSALLKVVRFIHLSPRYLYIMKLGPQRGMCTVKFTALFPVVKDVYFNKMC